jgi:hypothetical protein
MNKQSLDRYYARPEMRTKLNNYKRKSQGKKPISFFDERVALIKSLTIDYPAYSMDDGAFNLDGDVLVVSSISENKTRVQTSVRGYHVYCVGDKTKYFHRAVASHFWGPSELLVNHKDGNKLNNHPSNLEYVNNKQNIHHYFYELKKDAKKAYRHNTATGRVWYSRIKVSGKDIYLGSYYTREEAEAAYDQARDKFIKEEYESSQDRKLAYLCK